MDRCSPVHIQNRAEYPKASELLMQTKAGHQYISPRKPLPGKQQEGKYAKIHILETKLFNLSPLAFAPKSEHAEFFGLVGAREKFRRPLK